MVKSWPLFLIFPHLLMEYSHQVVFSHDKVVQTRNGEILKIKVVLGGGGILVYW